MLALDNTLSLKEYAEQTLDTLYSSDCFLKTLEKELFQFANFEKII